MQRSACRDGWKSEAKPAKTSPKPVVGAAGWAHRWRESAWPQKAAGQPDSATGQRAQDGGARDQCRRLGGCRPVIRRPLAVRLWGEYQLKMGHGRGARAAFLEIEAALHLSNVGRRGGGSGLLASAGTWNEGDTGRIPRARANAWVLGGYKERGWTDDIRYGSPGREGDGFVGG